MMISLFDWLWLMMMAVVVSGTIAYCIVAGRQEVLNEVDDLREELRHQRDRKKYWKARAKESRPVGLKSAGKGHIAFGPRSIAMDGGGRSASSKG